MRTCFASSRDCGKLLKNVFPLVVDDPKSVYIAIKDQKNFDEKKFSSKFLTPI